MDLDSGELRAGLINDHLRISGNQDLRELPAGFTVQGNLLIRQATPIGAWPG